MRIDVVQHVDFEGPGAIAEWSRARGHTLRAVRLHRGDRLPLAGESDALVVMGGPMGVADEGEYAWLEDEKRLVAEKVGQGGRVLGVCLGAQLIADALGARVFRNAHKEIGWWPIDWTEAARASRLLSGLAPPPTVFHWHGDTFDLPAGALRLASSAACANQAFVIGDRVLGLQFHVEVTPEGVADLVRHGATDLTPGPFVQGTEAMTAAPAAYEALHRFLFEVLDRWTRANAS